MISLTAEYALRAIVYLAYHFGEHHTAVDIAYATEVPPGYLAKVLRDLSKAGLVLAQRGQHGGYTLRQSPGTLTVLDVIDAVDPMRRIHECPLGLAAHRGRLCPLHRMLDNATAVTEETFRRVTLSSLLSDPTNQPLCGFRPRSIPQPDRPGPGSQD